MVLTWGERNCIRNVHLTSLLMVFRTRPVSEPAMLPVHWFNRSNRSDRSEEPNDWSSDAIIPLPKPLIKLGATSGIGAETARVLAKRGARLVLLDRNLKAAEETKARIVSEFPESEIVVMALDLSSLVSNNAGKFAHQHAISDDGIEMTFAILSWSFFADEAAGKHDDQNGESNGRSRKNSERVVKYSWLQMDANVTVNCVHHGIVRTRLTGEREGFNTGKPPYPKAKLLINEVEVGVLMNNGNIRLSIQAAPTTCYVATHPKLVNTSGKYFADCNEASTSKLGSNSNEAAKLWAASEIMVSRHAKAVFDPLNASGYYHM
ncbi:heat shock protein 83-like isoform 1 [Hibiscus syriacus]|uniref:Heat shock protein 83-like isoform 1 n=1 Tax=Hibiscus syriacus TaxID=106335 RepID=A0A6A3D056_HIBSY|nr:heat shock protein 83-like isoform 1 [Hibiscus syriacus]